MIASRGYSLGNPALENQALERGCSCVAEEDLLRQTQDLALVEHGTAPLETLTLEVGDSSHFAQTLLHIKPFEMLRFELLRIDGAEEKSSRKIRKKSLLIFGLYLDDTP